MKPGEKTNDHTNFDKLTNNEKSGQQNTNKNRL